MGSGVEWRSSGFVQFRDYFLNGKLILFCAVSQVLVSLDEGLGVSLVNKVPEELVFTTLSGIDVHFTRTAANEVLELSIQNIQVSSQLLNSSFMYTTPSRAKILQDASHFQETIKQK